MYRRIIFLFILFLLGRHLGFPSSPRYLELADSADFFIAHQYWDRAEEKIIEAMRLEPANFSNSLLLANLGVVQCAKGEYKKALETLTTGLNMAPSSTVLLNNRAHTYIYLNNTKEAAKDIDRSLAIDSIQQWPLQTRAFIYLQNEEFENARKLFSLMEKAFPDNESLYVGLAAIDQHEGNLKGAKENYRKALSLDENYDEAREAFIFLLINSEDYSEARNVIREGLKINPENSMYYLLRGYLHRLNYRNDEALADKKIAISKGIDPSYASSFIP